MPETPLAIHLDRLVRRMHLALQRAAPEFDRDKVGPGGGMLLLTMDELGPVPISALTEHLMRDKSQMTRSLRALEEKGLIARATSNEDSRVTYVSLSLKGRQTVETFQQAIAQALEASLTKLDAGETAQLSQLLAKAMG